MKIRVLLCDDQEQGRRSLRRLLEELEYVEVVAECGRGAEAAEMARKLDPDVIYMDIKMPGIDGIEAARRIREFSPMAFLVFATAYQDKALKAFELYCYDYLVKPFKFERIRQTMDRIKEEMEARQEEPSGELVVKVGRGTSVVKHKDTVFIEKVGKKTLIHTNRGTVETPEGIGELEQRLDPKVFIRVHAGYIINAAKISQIRPTGDRTYEVLFYDCHKTAYISRSHLSGVQERLLYSRR